MILANSTTTHFNNLPEIKDGQSCISGKIYKISCNTCRCGPNNSLICTKMACLEKAILEQMRTTKQHIKTETKSHFLNNKHKMENKSAKNGKRRKLSDKKSVSSNLPKLPKGKCIPGKTYIKGCRKCFCNNQKLAMCTKSCRQQTLLSSRLFDEDIKNLPLEMPTLMNSPRLPHMGVECSPGKSYYVQCNLCFCSERRDLYCTMKYCVNVKSYSESVLKKNNGQPCDEDFTKHCVRCVCRNKISSCKLLQNCDKMVGGKQLLADGNSTMKLALDIKKDKCEPNITYKSHCNNCFCQPDGGLRCTQRVCLTFSQIKDLQIRDAYLEKHGL